MMNSINTLTLGPDRGESRDTPAYTSPTPSYTGPPPPYQTSTPSYHTLPSHTLPAHSLPSHSRSLSADITQDKMKGEDQVRFLNDKLSFRNSMIGGTYQEIRHSKL